MSGSKHYISQVQKGNYSVRISNLLYESSMWLNRYVQLTDSLPHTYDAFQSSASPPFHPVQKAACQVLYGRF